MRGTFHRWYPILARVWCRGSKILPAAHGFAVLFVCSCKLIPFDDVHWPWFTIVCHHVRAALCERPSVNCFVAVTWLHNIFFGNRSCRHNTGLFGDAVFSHFSRGGLRLLRQFDLFCLFTYCVQHWLAKNTRKLPRAEGNKQGSQLATCVHLIRSARFLRLELNILLELKFSLIGGHWWTKIC